MSAVRVISSDKDGAELRREKRMNPRHTVCDGKSDADRINEALAAGGKKTFLGLGEAWTRIFGRRE